MKRILLAFVSVFLLQQFCHAKNPNIEATKGFAKLMKSAMDHKDAPATCWFLGQIRGYALALRSAGDKKAGKLVDVATNEVGKCGGLNSMDLTSTFTAEEWARLSTLQKKLESLNL